MRFCVYHLVYGSCVWIYYRYFLFWQCIILIKYEALYNFEFCISGILCTYWMYKRSDKTLYGYYFTFLVYSDRYTSMCCPDLFRYIIVDICCKYRCGVKQRSCLFLVVIEVIISIICSIDCINIGGVVVVSIIVEFDMMDLLGGSSNDVSIWYDIIIALCCAGKYRHVFID